MVSLRVPSFIVQTSHLCGRHADSGPGFAVDHGKQHHDVRALGRPADRELCGLRGRRHELDRDGLQYGVFPITGNSLEYDVVPFGATVPNYTVSYFAGLLTLIPPPTGFTAPLIGDGAIRASP